MKSKLFFVFLLLPAGICLAQDTLSPVLSLGFHRTIFGIDTAVIGGNCVLVAHRSGRPGTYFTSDGAYLINTADFSVSDTITGYTIYDVADVNNDGYPDFIGKDLDDSVIIRISPDHNTKLYSRHINWGKFVKSDGGYKIILGERVEFPGFVPCGNLCDGCVPPNVGYTERWGKYYLNAAVYDSEVNFVDSLPSCPFPSCIIGDNFYGYLRSGCYIRCWDPADPFGDFCEDEVIKHKIAKYRFNNEENTFDSIEISDTVVGGIVDFDVGIINGDDTLIALVAGPPSPLLAFWVELWFEDTMISTLHSFLPLGEGQIRLIPTLPGIIHKSDSDGMLRILKINGYTLTETDSFIIGNDEHMETVLLLDDKYYLITFKDSIINIYHLGSLIKIHTGWNLLSIPFDDTFVVADLFPFYIYPSWAWDNTRKAYSIANTVTSGIGFWLASPIDTVILINNSKATTSLSYTLYPGWNMIGALSTTVDCSEVTSLPTVVGEIYRFDTSTQSYEVADSIRSGNAYWIFVTEVTNVEIR